MDFLTKVKRKMTEKRMAFYARSVDAPLLFAPYPLSRYENTLKAIKNKKQSDILEFHGQTNHNTMSFIFRQDLDTLACLKKAALFIDLHTFYSVPMALFVRMDERDYPSEVSLDYMGQYIGHVPIGLHSSAYTEENPLNALRREIEKFQTLYHFSPQWLTLHGLGPLRYAERLCLIEELSCSYQDYGFVFADFIPAMRHYDYVIQDCHLMKTKRYVKRDLHILPPTIKGACCLVLVHPCYWVKEK
jgi:hypothetical protein